MFDVLRRGALAAGLLALAVAVVACGGGDTPEAGQVVEREDETVETSDAAGGGAGEVSAPGAWLNGSWVVDFSLTTVSPDAGWSRQAADQPTASWECSVDGDSMRIDNGMHVYDGAFLQTGDDWTYEGSATYLDDAGVEWTSVIEVTGVRTDDDTFGGEQWGEISSDSEGVLYTATWDMAGARATD